MYLCKLYICLFIFTFQGSGTSETSFNTVNFLTFYSIPLIPRAPGFFHTPLGVGFTATCLYELKRGVQLGAILLLSASFLVQIYMLWKCE